MKAVLLGMLGSMRPCGLAGAERKLTDSISEDSQLLLETIN